MYKTTSQLKRDAKDSLRGRWKEAVKLNLVPSLVKFGSTFLVILIIAIPLFLILTFSTGESTGGLDSQSSFVEGFKEGFNGEDMDYDIDEGYSGNDSFSSAISSATSSISSSWIITPIFSFVMTFLTIGISFTFLDTIRKKDEGPMKMGDAFRLFNAIDFVPVLLINVLIYFFTYLWTLLLVIPGIIKGYSYSQSNFIYKDLSSHKDTRSMGATSFITESRSLMKGHKGRLFWLDITFVGWYLLSFLTLGIGFLFLTPYMNATKAAFYSDLAKDRFLEPEITDEEDEEWTNF